MRITLLTYGSRGDVEPFAALARGLKSRGHQVCLAAPQVHSYLAEEAGVEFIGLPGDPRQLVSDFVDQAGANPWRMVLTMSRFVLPLAADVMEKAREASQGADAIIHSFLLTSTGYELARERGIPDISAQLFPVFTSTAEFAVPVFPELPWCGLYQRLSHEIVTQTFWQGSRILYGRIRRKHPGLPPLTGWPFAGSREPGRPILYGFSSQVVPRPRDWPARAHITGYWFSPQPAAWRPSAALLDFLAAGSPPIAITLGSTVSRDLTAFHGKVMDALSRSGQRGVIVGVEGSPDDPSRVFWHPDPLPYGWLFSRCAAVIHHGGAGTTGRALQAGVPNIVIPFTSDQPFWGRRVYALGAGPRPIPARRLTAPALAEAIHAALDGPQIKARAGAIGEGIRAEDGVARAVEVIEGILGRRQDLPERRFPGN